MDANDWVEGVDDPTLYEREEPPELSARCRWWIQKLDQGWTPGATVKVLEAKSAAKWYGIYIWEYNNIVWPMLTVARMDALVEQFTRVNDILDKLEEAKRRRHG